MNLFLENTACNQGCPYIFDPYCGLDGKTYNNWCLFEVAQCEDHSLVLNHRGECKGKYIYIYIYSKFSDWYGVLLN